MACTDRITLRPTLPSEAHGEGPDQGEAEGRGAVDSSAVLHLLPCCIEHNGPANVSTFFSVQVENADACPPVLVSAFRGRRLRGATLELPPAYRGVVLREQEGAPTDASPLGAEAEAEVDGRRGDGGHSKEEGAGAEEGAGEGAGEGQGWVEDGSFSSFTYWQHDTGPRDSDGPRKALDWLSLAHQMHKPVTLEEMSGT